MAQPNLSTSVPDATQPIQVDNAVSQVWIAFFVNLWNRSGGAGGSFLDTLGNVVGSIPFRGASVWQALSPAARFKVLRMGTTLPQWDTLDGNSFGPQAPSSFFAAPVGVGGIPPFRAIATADLPAGEIPGTAAGDDATAGNFGEYAASQILFGGAIGMVSGTAKDVTSIALSPGDWDVWGTVASAPAGATTTSLIRGWIGAASATDPGAPNNGAYVQTQTALAAGSVYVAPIGRTRITVPAGPPKTAFLSTRMDFAAGTMGAYGFIGARRAR